jgi:hypothetical protein
MVTVAMLSQTLTLLVNSKPKEYILHEFIMENNLHFINISLEIIILSLEKGSQLNDILPVSVIFPSVISSHFYSDVSNSDLSQEN